MDIDRFIHCSLHYALFIGKSQSSSGLISTVWKNFHPPPANSPEWMSLFRGYCALPISALGSARDRNDVSASIPRAGRRQPKFWIRAWPPHPRMNQRICGGGTAGQSLSRSADRTPSAFATLSSVSSVTFPSHRSMAPMYVRCSPHSAASVS